MWGTQKSDVLAESGKKYVHYFVPLWVAARVKDNPNELLLSTPLIQRRARVNTESEAAPW
jgi:hypothetical protein